MEFGKGSEKQAYIGVELEGWYHTSLMDYGKKIAMSDVELEEGIGHVKIMKGSEDSMARIYLKTATIALQPR